MQERELEKSELRGNLFTKDSPRVLQFGTYKCGSIAMFEIEFMSGLDQQKHFLNVDVSAPLDKKKYTFGLNWMTKKDTYEIYQDGQMKHRGTISTDFVLEEELNRAVAPV